MDEIEQTNKVKILKELEKNGRASASEIAEKIGLSRQTVSKTISNMEKKKEIWGYTVIFDPRIINKKLFLFLCKVDLSIKTEDLLKKLIDSKRIDENERKLEFKTSIFLNGSSDFIVTLWANDIIEAKKRMNFFKRLFETNLKEIETLEVISIFRNNSIANPKMVEEWTNLII